MRYMQGGQIIGMDSNRSASSSDLAFNLLDLRMDNKRVTEELATCKVLIHRLYNLWLMPSQMTHGDKEICEKAKYTIDTELQYIYI